MRDDAESGGCGQSRISLILTHVVVLDDVWQSPATGSEGIVDLASPSQRRVFKLDVVEHDTKHVHHRSALNPYWTKKSHKRRNNETKVICKRLLNSCPVAQGQRSRLQRHWTFKAGPIQSVHSACILALRSFQGISNGLNRSTEMSHDHRRRNRRRCHPFRCSRLHPHLLCRPRQI